MPSTIARALAAVCLIIGGLMAIGPCSATASTLPPGFQDETVFEGLQEPTAIRFAPDGRVFVAEKPGLIVVFDSLQDTTPTVFADLRTQVFDQGDRGILGLALDPDFSANHYVYALYTYDHLLGEAAPAPKWGQPNQAGDPCPKPEDADVDDCPVSGRLVRLTGEGDHAVKEEVGGEQVPSEDVLVEDWCQQFSSHSIGDLQFGPEGALFASGGDGASFNDTDYGQFGWPQKNECGDPPGQVGEELTPPTAEGGSLRAQNTENLDGSIIRVDPETGEGMPENPMASSLNPNRRRIIAYGFRNPFRFAIDPESDEVYTGNVGWYTYEEIDRFSTTPSPAYNSGWPCFEGPGPTPGFDSLGLEVCDNLYENEGAGLTAPPFFYYEHESGVTPGDTCPTEFGSAIAGLDFYEGDAFPASYKGALFFSDPVRQCIYVMFPGADGRPDPSTTTPFLTGGGLYPGVDVQEGPEGALFYVKLFGEEYGPGEVHRIFYSSGNQPPVAHLKVDHEWSAGDLNAEFDATGSTDADGEQLEYEWDVNDDGSFAPPTTDGTIDEAYADSQNHTVAVRVRDGHGATSIDRITVYPHDTPPQPTIVEPSPSLEWHVGEPIYFEGAAEDSEDGPLPPSSLGWNSRLYHCPSACHVHPLQAFTAVDSGTLIAPDHDYPSRIALALTATDSRGLEASTTVEIYPHPVVLTVESDPPGLTLSAGQLTGATPFALTAIEDSKITLVAPPAGELEGHDYTWTGWSDEGERVHTVVADHAASYRAMYAPLKEPGAGTGDEQPPAPKGEVAPPLAAPNTLLGRHPARRTPKPTAKFTFSSSEPGGTFRCKLDSAPFRPCRSPRELKNLKPGKHTLKVEAVDAQGNADPSPFTFGWTVVPPKSQSPHQPA
ncbi:MAG TPA: PQQ-dependent sugar dehydrogenase [Solirubrobacterales bacterium]